ncbi:MAG: PEGA domain-containing protein [Acidobacteriota bacterium]
MKASRRARAKVIPFFCLWLPLLLAGSAAVKVKVIVDNATVKATPEIGSQTLANVPLHTVLEAELKQGEWYKVSMTKDGTLISGYIHELLVQEAVEGEESPAPSPGGLAKTQAEIVAELELKVEESRNLIRQEKELDKATDDLRPLLARAFTVEDRKRQKQLACEIYLWLGLALAKRGDQYGALKEFRSMFEVDYGLAKDVTRNIYDPVVSGFIDHAEKLYRGLLVEYTYEIMTDPKEATIRVDGKEIGLSPEVYRTAMPKFTLEIFKEGYRPVKEEVFLSQANSKKEITLQSIGRTLVISSDPPGAQVFLDEVATGKMTDCEIPYVPYGGHGLRLKKENWADHEENIQVLEGQGPLTISARLTVKNYVLGIKMGGPESKSFKLPKAIAFDQEGNFYVADEGDVKLKKYDPQGRAQSGWGNAGREFRVLKEPSGIVADGQGCVAFLPCHLKRTEAYP